MADRRDLYCSRCVVAIYVSMERPNAATVALVLSRIVLPKQVWLEHLGKDVSWRCTVSRRPFIWITLPSSMAMRSSGAASDTESS